MTAKEQLLQEIQHSLELFIQEVLDFLPFALSAGQKIINPLFERICSIEDCRGKAFPPQFTNLWTTSNRECFALNL